MKTLTLDHVSKEHKRVPAEVKVPEIEAGMVAYVLAPSPDDRDLCEMQWTHYSRSHDLGNVGFRKFVVAWCLCDADNNRLHDSGPEENRVTPAFIDYMEKVNKLPLTAITRLFDTAMQKLGMSKSDQEELVKNSETTSSDGGSGSKPKPSDSDEKPGSDSSKTPEK